MQHSELRRAVTLTELAPSPYVSIKKVSLVDIKVFATFDEFHLLPFQAIKEKSKCHRWKDRRTDGRKDVKTESPPPQQTYFAGGVISSELGSHCPPPSPLPPPSMSFIHQIVLKIQCKSTRPWNIGHAELHVHVLSSSTGMMFIHHIPYKISVKSTSPWNKDHCDLHLCGCERSGHTDSMSQSMMFIHQIVLRSMAKSLNHEMFMLMSMVPSYWLIIPKYHPSNTIQDTRQNHWTENIGHCDLLLFWCQRLCHTALLSQRH